MGAPGHDIDRCAGPIVGVCSWPAARDVDGARDIYVAHWDGAQWEDVGTLPIRATGAAHFDSDTPHLIVADGVPTLAWSESDMEAGPFVYVAQYDGSRWQILCGPVRTAADHTGSDPSLAYDADNRRLYVAFEDFISGSPQIAVMALDLP